MEPGRIATEARVRVRIEHALLERLAQDAGVALTVAQYTLPEPQAVRRQLLGRAVRLTEAMAPKAIAAAVEIRDAFGLTSPVEIYQSAGRENAAMHLLREPILMETSVNRITREVRERVVHPAHVPFEREAETAIVHRRRDTRPCR